MSAAPLGASRCACGAGFFAASAAGAAALADALTTEFDFHFLVGVLGVMADKDAAGIIEALHPVLDEVVVSRSSSPRAMAPDDLADIAREYFDDDRVHVVDRLDAALDLAVERAEASHTPGAGVLVTGSIPLAGEIRTLLGRS